MATDCNGAVVMRDNIVLHPSLAGGSSLKESYATTLQAHVFTHSRYLPIVKPPVQKGNYLSVTLDDKLHQIGLHEHEHSLIGRMLFKISLRQLLTTDQLKAALDYSWSIVGSWHIIPLGKGYYNIHSDNIIESNHILYKRSWPMEFGTMRSQLRTPNFNPYCINSLIDKVWNVSMSFLLSIFTF